MIVKDVTRLAKELDKACKKGDEVLNLSIDYVGSRKGVTVHLTAEGFMHRFNTYTASAWSEVFPCSVSAVIDGVTYLALLSQEEMKKYGIDISGTEDK